MKAVWMTLSMVALIVLLVLPILHAYGVASYEASRWGITLGTVGWFATAPFWMQYRPPGKKVS